MGTELWRIYRTNLFRKGSEFYQGKSNRLPGYIDGFIKILEDLCTSMSDPREYEEYNDFGIPLIYSFENYNKY